MTIVKSELIDLLAKRQPDASEKDISTGVNVILQEIMQALVTGGRAEIRDFGSFCLHYHPPRNAHNPRTGAKVKTKGKYSPYFKPGKDLRERVNVAREFKPVISDSVEE